MNNNDDFLKDLDGLGGFSADDETEEADENMDDDFSFNDSAGPDNWESSDNYNSMNSTTKSLKEHHISNRKTEKLMKELLYKFYKYAYRSIKKVPHEQLPKIISSQKNFVEITLQEFGVEFLFKNNNFSDSDFYKLVEANKSKFITIAQDLFDFEDDVKSVFVYRKKVYVVKNSLLEKESVLKSYFGNMDNNKMVIGVDMLNKETLAIDQVEDLRMVQIIGTSGSGKSVLLRWMLLSGLAKAGKMNFFVLEKATDFDNMFKYKWMLYKNTVGNMGFEDIITLFLYFFLEKERRDRLFQKEWVANINWYNKIMRQRWEPELPVVTFLVDEFKELRDSLKRLSVGSVSIEDKFLKYLSSLIQVTRAAGIYFWLSTQQWGSKSIPTDVRGNLNTHIIGKIDSSQARSIGMLTSEERKLAEANKLHHWDFLVKSEKGTNLVRTPLFEGQDDFGVNGILTNYFPKKENPPKNLYKYSKDMITKLTDKLVKDLDIKMLQYQQRMMGYWVSEKDPNLQGLSSLQKKSVYVIVNMFIKWFDKTSDIIENKTIMPSNFDIEKEIDNLGNKHKEISMVFVYVLYIYNKFFADYVKNNFNLQRWNYKKIIKEWEPDEKYEMVEEIKAKIIDFFDVVLNEMSEL